MKITIGELKEYIRDVLSPRTSTREQIKSLGPALDMDPHLEPSEDDEDDFGPVPPNEKAQSVYSPHLDPFTRGWQQSTR